MVVIIKSVQRVGRYGTHSMRTCSISKYSSPHFPFIHLIKPIYLIFFDTINITSNNNTIKIVSYGMTDNIPNLLTGLTKNEE